MFAPMIQQRRYATWSNKPEKIESLTCLQYAMWTLAASVSTQFQYLPDILYKNTKRLLDTLDNKDTNIGFIDLEQVQAWILLAIYEFMRSNYRRGWISAGRSFRLVQLMRLYEIDTPKGIHNRGDWLEIEEKRRTFWMAYSLDRFSSVRNDWYVYMIILLIVRRPQTI